MATPGGPTLPTPTTGDGNATNDGTTTTTAPAIRRPVIPPLYGILFLTFFFMMTSSPDTALQESRYKLEISKLKGWVEELKVIRGTGDGGVGNQSWWRNWTETGEGLGWKNGMGMGGSWEGEMGMSSPEFNLGFEFGDGALKEGEEVDGSNKSRKPEEEPWMINERVWWSDTGRPRLQGWLSRVLGWDSFVPSAGRSNSSSGFSISPEQDSTRQPKGGVEIAKDQSWRFKGGPARLRPEDWFSIPNSGSIPSERATHQEEEESSSDIENEFKKPLYYHNLSGFIRAEWWPVDLGFYPPFVNGTNNDTIQTNETSSKEEGDLAEKIGEKDEEKRSFNLSRKRAPNPIPPPPIKDNNDATSSSSDSSSSSSSPSNSTLESNSTLIELRKPVNYTGNRGPSSKVDWFMLSSSPFPPNVSLDSSTSRPDPTPSGIFGGKLDMNIREGGELPWLDEGGKFRYGSDFGNQQVLNRDEEEKLPTIVTLKGSMLIAVPLPKKGLAAENDTSRSNESSDAAPVSSEGAEKDSDRDSSSGSSSSSNTSLISSTPAPSPPDDPFAFLLEPPGGLDEWESTTTTISQHSSLSGPKPYSGKVRELEFYLEGIHFVEWGRFIILAGKTRPDLREVLGTLGLVVETPSGRSLQPDANHPVKADKASDQVSSLDGEKRQGWWDFIGKGLASRLGIWKPAKMRDDGQEEYFEEIANKTAGTIEMELEKRLKGLENDAKKGAFDNSVGGNKSNPTNCTWVIFGQTQSLSRDLGDNEILTEDRLREYESEIHHPTGASLPHLSPPQISFLLHSPTCGMLLQASTSANISLPPAPVLIPSQPSPQYVGNIPLVISPEMEEGGGDEQAGDDVKDDASSGVDRPSSLPPLSSREDSGLLTFDIFWNKARNYALSIMVVTIIQTLSLVRQMEWTSSNVAIMKLSYISILLHVFQDFYTLITHLMLASMTMGSVSLPLLASAFFSSLSSMAFGFRYAIHVRILQALEDYSRERERTRQRQQQQEQQARDGNTNSENTAGNDAANRETVLPVARPTTDAAGNTATTGTASGTRTSRDSNWVDELREHFGSVLVVSGFITTIAVIIVWGWVILLTIVLYSYWIPQIITNAKNNQRGQIMLKEYILTQTLCRLFIPLYVWGCPTNVLFNETSNKVNLLVVYVFLQSLLLYSQSLSSLGPRWFLPRTAVRFIRGTTENEGTTQGDEEEEEKGWDYHFVPKGLLEGRPREEVVLEMGEKQRLKEEDSAWEDQDDEKDEKEPQKTEPKEIECGICFETIDLYFGASSSSNHHRHRSNENDAEGISRFLSEVSDRLKTAFGQDGPRSRRKRSKSRSPTSGSLEAVPLTTPDEEEDESEDRWDDSVEEEEDTKPNPWMPSSTTHRERSHSRSQSHFRRKKDSKSNLKGRISRRKRSPGKGGLRNKKVMVPPCGHVFHTECLERWMGMKRICPVCRSGLPQPRV